MIMTRLRHRTAAPPPSSGGQAQWAQTSKSAPGKATASLVLGIVGIFICPLVCSVLAIIFGQQARRQIKQDPSLGGEGVSTAGYILGIVGVVLFGAIILFWIVAIAVGS